jgi:hypothetical protein
LQASDSRTSKVASTSTVALSKKGCVADSDSYYLLSQRPHPFTDRDLQKSRTREIKDSKNHLLRGLNPTRKQVVSAPLRLRQRARHLYQRKGVSSTPTLIIFYPRGPIPSQTEICKNQEPEKKRLKEPSSQRLESHSQASSLRTSKVASTSTISLIDYTISSGWPHLSSPKLRHSTDQRSTKIENLENKRLKEPSSQRLESHSQASSLRTSKVAPMNIISDKDCIG